MILIADSGSTKCDWILVDKKGKPQNDFKTMGFNPFFHDADFVFEKVSENKDLIAHADEISFVFFYGAGCSAPHLNKKIEKGLEMSFPQAEVNVDHDLVGAAYACYNGEPNITCIIGTGSNSCFFDGDTVKEEVPALAYILGDEASGSYFGKQLLAGYLYNRLPEAIATDFKEKYGLTKNEIFENVYNKPHANVYLASFMRFLSDHRDHPFVQEMIYEGMKKYLDIHVTCYKDYQSYPVNFVGSVAYYFEDILKKAAKEFGIKVRSITKKPINGLAHYHFRYKLSFA